MSRAWMPLYVADYLADTGHLSAAEHGAYLLLIMHYWQNGGLPDEDRRLARIARMSPVEWQDSRDVLSDLFGDGWKHDRIEAELQAARDISEKAKEKAAKRWQKNSNAGADAAAYADAKPEHMPEACQSQSQSPDIQLADANCPTAARRHEWPEDFVDQVWASFPRKTEKKTGVDALNRLHRADRVAWADIIGGVESLQDSDPQYVPALARWIKGERWKDERPASRSPPAGSRNNRSLIDGLDEIERRFSDVPAPSYPRLAG